MTFCITNQGFHQMGFKEHYIKKTFILYDLQHTSMKK